MTKEQLKQYRQMELERRQLRELLDELEAAMYSPKAQKLTGMPGAASRSNDTMDNLVAKHAAIEERYRRKIAELSDQLAEIEAAIDPLPPLERTLLRARYIEGMTWEAVCCKIGYSWQQTHRLHARALQHLRTEEDKVCG